LARKVGMKNSSTTKATNQITVPGTARCHNPAVTGGKGGGVYPVSRVESLSATHSG
jgi:hypothetical protein